MKKLMQQATSSRPNEMDVPASGSTHDYMTSKYSRHHRLPWRTVRMSTDEIKQVRAVLNARFPQSGGNPVIDLTAALDAAEW